MSETLELSLAFRTAAAQAAGKEMTDTVHGLVDASEAAGKSTKKLGTQIAGTKGEQLLAIEAIKRAQEAQRELTLTERAHGKNSAEAAAAKKRLVVAQVEARKAAADAAVSFEKTAKATTAAAKAADGELSPSLRRNAAQLERMGKEVDRAAGELRKMELEAIAAGKGTDRLGKGISALTVAGGNLIAGGISRAVRGIGESMTASVTAAIDYEKAFVGITKVMDDKSAESIGRVDTGVKELATSLGVLPTEVAAMVQSLAASGLQSDLMGYTEDAAKLGVAFDLTGQEAGHAIASLTASLGLSREEMQSLTGTINMLDDGMNSSSKQLVEYLESVAGIGRQASISGETMLALGSAIISTGAAPDKAATGVKNFIATMEAGAAATDAQQAAFKKLGFEAEAVAKQMATGHAEEQIKKISAALADVKPEERFGVMIDLFGRESIGSIGGLATGVDLLGKSFEIAGNKMGAAGSVQAEFERVSQTSAHKIEQLKAQVQVLGISLGEQLLPHVNNVVAFLSSPEGQDWGREAVSKAVGAVEGLITVVGAVADGFSALSDMAGGADKALAGIAVTALALTGPLGAAAAAGAAIGYGMAEAYDWAARKILGDTGRIGAKMQALLNEASDIRHKEHEAEMKAANEELAADQKYADQHAANMAKADALASRYEAAELARLGKRATEEEKLAAFRKSRQLASAVSGNSRLLGGGTEEDRLAQFEKYVSDKEPDAPHQMSAKDKKKQAKAAKSAARAQAKEDKHAAKFAEDLYDFDQEIATYSAKLAKELREEDLKSQMSAEERKHDAQLDALDREKELLDAGLRAGEDATAAHESLLMRRLAADEAYARKQFKLAKTDEQREKAQTAIEAAQHGRRVANLRAAMAAEEKAHEKKLAVIAHANDLIGTITETTTSAILDGALAQKGALWTILGEELKVTAKRYTIVSASEFAQAAVAAATYNYPGAVAHATAGGMAAGVAALAGGAGMAATKIGEARAGSPKAESAALPEERGAGITGAGKAGGASDSGSADKFEKSDIPVSFNERNPAQSSGGGERVFNITVNVGNMMGDRDKRKLGQDIIKFIREAEGGGKRY